MDGIARADGRQGIGQSVPRLEDDRYLRGKGEFIADIRLSGMRDLAFVRSPVAHARIRSIRKPAGAEASVFIASDLVGVQPIVAVSGLPGFKPSVQPVLATDKVRHVGEAIAVCVAATRAEAEDLAATVEIDFDELPALVDMRAALISETKVHEHWVDNNFLETFVEVAPERFAQPSPDHGAPPPAHGTAMHVAAGRPRCRRHLGSAARTTADLQLHADAAHRANRIGRLSRLG